MLFCWHSISSSPLCQRTAYLLISRCSLAPHSKTVINYQMCYQIVCLWFNWNKTCPRKDRITFKVFPFICQFLHPDKGHPRLPRMCLLSFDNPTLRPWRFPELQRFFKQLCKSWRTAWDRDIKGMSRQQVELLSFSQISGSHLERNL